MPPQELLAARALRLPLKTTFLLNSGVNVCIFSRRKSQASRASRAEDGAILL
jgi:hypothetical protein